MHSQVGLPSTILLSYASPFENTAKLILSDGIIELINGTITLQTPRDHFDKNGFFSPSNKKILKSFPSSKDYFNDSIAQSVLHFLKITENYHSFPLENYLCSLDSTKALLTSEAYF